MTSTVLPAPRVLGAASAEPAVESVEWAEADVFGLDAAETLGFVVERRRRADVAAAEELRAVTHWADLHRVEHVGATDPEIATAVTRRSAGAGLTGLAGLEGELRLAGQGAFRVAEFAVAELAAALGLSEPAGRAYVGQALELRDRLPRCWERVMTGELPAWKARQIAEQTIPLPAAAADWVDAQLAAFAHRLSLTRILRAVDAAVLRFDPEEAARRAEAAAEKRGVWREDRVDGTSTVTAVADTPDAAAFDAALDSVAAGLGRLGDRDPHRVRRAKALGVLADPQYALTLTTHDPAPAPRAAVPQESPGRSSTAELHVHVHVDGSSDDAAPGPLGPVGPVGPVARVSGHGVCGARDVQTVERWITGLRPGAVVRVTPVVDLAEHLAVDAYEVPRRLSDQLEHRDLTCRFPWCPRTGGLDQDHIVPYRSGDPGALPDGGDGRPPPGQTATSNLARLCRFHHRLKTHGGWTYTLTHDTVFTWTSPLGRRYGVDENGTRPLL